MISLKDNVIVIENDLAEIHLSKSSAKVLKVISKRDGKDILSKEETVAFELLDKDEQPYKTNSLSLDGNVITVNTELGDFKTEVTCCDNHFIFELITNIPSSAYIANIMHIKYDYDHTDTNCVGAAGIALTYWANPVFFPIPRFKETLFRVMPHLRDKNAKYALLIASVSDHLDIIKNICQKIDKNVGIVSSTGGAYARESKVLRQNYNIQYQSNKKDIYSRIQFYKDLGVDQIDFHLGYDTFRQGDFRFVNYKDAKDFKKQITDVLEENGISASLHTYSAYIDYEADDILCHPENLKQLRVKETYTLAEDLKSDSEYVKVEENIDGVITETGFYSKNTPYVFIDGEIIAIEKDENGLRIVSRATSGSKEEDHKKGSKVIRPFGFYHSYFPLPDSELFLEVARRTAKTYNEGGFKMIYLDALDSICSLTSRSEYWFYYAKFICELLKYCETDPIIEASDNNCSFWAARGRAGAWDPPARAYKGWNKLHTSSNKNLMEYYQVPILGWYDLYPPNKNNIGNHHTKYQHTDDIDYLGALSVMYGFPFAYRGIVPGSTTSLAAKRNMAIFKEYDNLRKQEYFSESYRNKLKESPYELKLVNKGKKYTFIEKDYQKEKFYDLNNEERNKAEFNNPFGKQTPFVRIEALLSSKKKNPTLVLPLDENKNLKEQTLEIVYPSPLNISNNVALKVNVLGNGKKGSAIAVKLRNIGIRTMAEYIIDTDFEGWREFILIETDNGERPDLPFDKREHQWNIYGSLFDFSKVTKATIELTENVDGVRMSSITACEHLYDVLSNPTVKIGESEVKFDCEIKSSDYIEFDGKKAVVIDRYGNERPIHFTSTLIAPRGKFKAELTAKSLNKLPARAILTFGFTGKEIK